MMHPFLQPAIDEANIATGLANNANKNAMATPSRIRFARIAIPSILANNSTTVSVTWLTPYADTNYTVIATIESTSILGKLQLNCILSRTTTGATFSIANLNVLGGPAGGGTLHVIAIHD